MGIESYHINTKLIRPFAAEEFKAWLEDNLYVVTPHYKKMGWLFPKRMISENDVVINKIVICTLNDNEISLQACFSCFDDSICLIGSILKDMKIQGFIDCAYYGHYFWDLNTNSVDSVIDSLCLIQYERLKYFRDNYTKEVIHLLPSQFFEYYRKHNR